MKRAIDAGLAKAIDAYSIDNGMPSLVLMERAALEVARVIRTLKGHKVAAVCGVGNNGADGLAVLRILAQEGYDCHAFVIGDVSKGTKEYVHQAGLLDFYKISLTDFNQINFAQDIPENIFSEYDIIVDAIFGVGLSRNVQGQYERIIDIINKTKGTVVSVDIPSGVDASTGHIMGISVKADITVTFGYAKTGQLLYPGKSVCGRLHICDIGFLPWEKMAADMIAARNIAERTEKDAEDDTIENIARTAYYFDGDFISDGDFCHNRGVCANVDFYTHADFYLHVPVRERRSNKGNYGNPLIIAGSKDMTGAAFLSARAAYRTGAGVVTVLTHKSADEYLKSVVPEAIVRSYGDDVMEEAVLPFLDKASVVVMGPGIAVNSTSEKLVRLVLNKIRVPIIADADALNIIAKEPEILKTAQAPVIITPHVGEMARLTGFDKKQIIDDILGTALRFAAKYGVYCVLKDAVSAVASPHGRLFLSTAGNPGMATAGSGDVLTGIMAAVCDWKNEDDLYTKVCIAVQLHGMAGDAAAIRLGEHSLMAGDIAEAVAEVLKFDRNGR